MKIRLIGLMSLIGLIFFLMPSEAFAADLYWVGDAGAATNVAGNWKTTDPSGCGGGDASAAPTTTDVAIFDADCDNNASITGTFSVQGVNMNSGYGGTVSQNAVTVTIGSSGWTQAGGTFTGNSDGSTANITIGSGGDFNLTGGIFTSTNDTLTLNDDFTVNGGTFTANSGTAYFQASADNAQTITGSFTASALTFYEAACASYTVTIASGTTITASGTVTTDGSSCGWSALNGPGGISAQGNITTLSDGWEGTAVITVNGSDNQTLTGVSNFPTTYGSLPAMTISKSSGTITLTNTISVADDFNNSTNTNLGGTGTLGITAVADDAATVTGTFTIAGGLYFENGENASKTITIASGSTITVEGTTSFRDTGCCETRSINGPGAISAKGNITTVSQGWGGTAVITVNGDGTQTLTGVSNFPTSYGAIPTVTINKSQGSITLTDTIAVTNDFTNSTNTNLGGTGTLAIYPVTDGAITITGTFTTPGLYFFNDSNNDKTITIASGSTITVTGTTTFRDSGCCVTRSINGPGGISAQGDITTVTNGWGGSTPVTLSGSSNQTVTIAGGSSVPTGTVTFNKSGGTITLAAAWSINSSGQDLVVAGGSTQTLTGAYTLTVNDSTTISGSLTQGTTTISSASYTVSAGGNWTNQSTGDITVGSGGVTNSGTINFDGTQFGCGDADAIAITSSSGGTARTWTGKGVYTLYDVTISDQTDLTTTSKSGRMAAYSSTNSSNSNFSVVSTCPSPPLLYWAYDDAQGTTAQDSSSNNLDGTVSDNTNWREERLCMEGKCLYFDGANNDNVTKSDDSKLDFGATDNFTVQAWVKRNGTSSAINYIATKHDVTDDTEDGGYKLWMDADGDFCFGIDDDVTWGPDISACSTNANFDDDKWHLVTGVRDQTSTDKIYVYVDGVEKSSGGTSDTTSDTLANSNAFYAGVDRDGTSNEWLGFMDEVKVYDYARSANQVKTDFVAGAKNAGSKPGTAAALGAKTTGYLSEGLVGYWKMDESSGNAADSSGNGLTLTNNSSVAYAGGKFGNSAQGDGTADYLNTASTISGIQTVSFWANTPDTTNYFINLINSSAYITSSSGTISATGFTSPSVYVNGVLNGTLTASTWNHIVVTTGTGINANAFAVGLTNDGSNHFLTNTSKIDDVRVYSRAISGKEIRDLYNFAPGPVGYWNFEEGSGSTTNDYSGNNNSGTITSSHTFTADTANVGSAKTYDGLDITIPNGITVNMWGTHTFRSVTIQNGGILDTGQYNQSGDTTRGQLFITANTINVNSGGTINAYGRGSGGGGGGGGSPGFYGVSGGTGGTTGASSVNGDTGGNAAGNEGGNGSKGGGYGGSSGNNGAWGEPGSGGNGGGTYAGTGGAQNSNGTRGGYMTSQGQGDSSTAFPSSLSDTTNIVMGSGGGGGGGGAGGDDGVEGSDGGAGGAAGGAHAGEGGGGGGGGGGAGGGIIMLDANQSITISGTVTADGAGANSASYPGYGAGGGITIKAPTIDISSATIRSMGGSANGTSGGSSNNGGTFKAFYSSLSGSCPTTTTVGRGYCTTTSSFASNTGAAGNLYTVGKAGKAANFSANNPQYVSVSNTISGVQSVSFWAKPSSTTEYLIDLDGGTHYIWINSGSLTATGFSSPTYYVNGIATQTVVANQWQYITVTTATSFNTSSMKIGWANGTYFTGSLDELKIYNYVRTQKQIVEDMNAGHPAVGSPVGSAVTHWKFDEGYLTTANDSTPNDNDLTLSSASWTNAGKFGKAFNGATNIRLSRADDADLDFAASDDFTISGWFKSDSATNPSANEYLVEKGSTVGSAAIGYAIYTSSSSDGLVCFGIDDDAVTNFPEDSVCSVSDFYDNTWHHVVATKTSSRLDLYIDGKPNGTADTSISATGTLENAATFYLGDTNGTDGTDEFLGDLDEVKVYRFALTSDEVKTEHNRGQSLQLGAAGNNSTYQPQAANQEYCVPGDSTSCAAPVGRWDFEEGGGTSTNDTSGNGYSGTITGATYKNGKFGKALNFNGSTDVVDTISSISGIKTVSFWVNPSTTTQNLMDLQTTPGTMNVSVSGGTVSATGFTSPTIYVNGIVNGTVTANTWNHVEITTATAITGSAVRFGRINTTSLTGKLDTIRFYDYARTTAQVAWDYNRGKPIAHWKLDECQGSSVYDSSGNGNTGTISIGGTGDYTAPGTCTTGTATHAWNAGATGKLNFSLGFDGADDNISRADDSDLDFAATDNFTVSAWVKHDGAISTDPDYILVKHDVTDDTEDGGYKLYMDETGDLCFGIDDDITWGPDISACTDGVDFDDSSWHQVTGVRDQTGTDKIYLYVDGKERANTADSTTATLANSNSFYVGVDRDGTSNEWDGQIDDVKVFRYGLTATQVKDIMNEGAVRFGPSTGAP